MLAKYSFFFSPFSSPLFLSSLLSLGLNLPGWFVRVFSTRTVSMCVYLVCIGEQSRGLCQFSLHWESMVLDRWKIIWGGGGGGVFTSKQVSNGAVCPLGCTECVCVRERTVPEGFSQAELINWWFPRCNDSKSLQIITEWTSWNETNRWSSRNTNVGT